MLITNARIFDGVRFIDADSVQAENGIITRVFKRRGGLRGALDLKGALLAPALIDLHVHHPGWRSPGGMNDACGFEKLRLKLRRQGVCAFLCASVYDDGFEYRIPGTATGAECLGFYLEGPFINSNRRGAIDFSRIKNVNSEIISRLFSVKGLKAVVVAPELKGGLGAIRRLTSKGIKVAIGHTAAGERLCRAAFKAGAKCVTHLFNAMDAFDSGRGGIFKAISETKGIFAELIADGEHVQDVNVLQAFRVIGPEKLILVSDYTAEKNKDGVLKGGNKPLLWSCLRLVNELGLEFENVFRCASYNPAKYLGLNAGRIKPGYKAEFIQLQIKSRLNAGGE